MLEQLGRRLATRRVRVTAIAALAALALGSVTVGFFLRRHSTVPDPAGLSLVSRGHDISSDRPGPRNSGARVAAFQEWPGTNHVVNSATSNRVISGYHFTGTFQFSGDGLAFDDCLFDGGLILRGNDVSVRHSTFVGGGLHMSGNGNATLEALNISGFSDGIQIFSDTGQPQNIVVKDNWLHDPTPSNGAHADGMQVKGAHALTVSHNVIDMGAWVVIPGGDLNSAILIDAPGPPSWKVVTANTDVVITDNWLNGAGFTVRLGNPNPGNVTLTNNRFGRDAHWGLFLDHTKGAVPLQQAFGNVWADTQQPVPSVPIVNG